jgi:hypothetical protein
VWDDLDQDGRQDAGEPGLANVTVQLWNTAKTDLLSTDVTDANGIYTVIAPTPGQYRVRIVLPAINDQFSPKDNAAAGDNADSDFNPSGTNFGFTDIISIASNVISITNIDGGIIKFRTATPTRTPTPINIGNFVWDDLDGDGRQDAGEPGLANVTVQLWNDAKNDLISSDVTDANGIYTVIAPTPGNYRVRIVLPAINDEFSPKDVASAGNNLDSDFNPSGADFGFTDVFAIASNVISITNIDGGIIKFRTATPTRTPTPINVGNRVWNDLNANGIQDGGEPGLLGITVQLWNSTKTFLYDSDVTDANGIYTVIAPTPGDYRVRVLLPAGADFAPKNQGGDDNVDSDINVSILTLNRGYTDIYNFGPNLISIVSIDAGLIDVQATPTLTNTRTATRTATATATASNTPGGIPSETPTATDTLDPSITPSATLTPSATNTEEPTETATDTETPTETFTATFTLDPSITPSATETPIQGVGTELPTDTPTDIPPTDIFDVTATSMAATANAETAIASTIAAAPPTPRCDLRNFVENDIIRASVPIEFDLYCRTLVQNGQFLDFLGVDITSLANVGIEALINLGMIHAVDVFSPSGQSYFNGGYVMCLAGQGTLIWLDATNAPRRAEIIGSYSVDDFPGYTCATLFTQGTIILVEINPVAQ